MRLRKPTRPPESDRAPDVRERAEAGEPDLPEARGRPPESERAEIPGEPPDIETAHAPAPVAPVTVPRWIQLVLLPLGLLALWALAHAAGTVLLILMIAGVIAVILNPLVKVLERGRVP